MFKLRVEKNSTQMMCMVAIGGGEEMYHCLSCTLAAGVYLPQLSGEVITGPTQQTASVVASTKCSKAWK